MQRCTRNQRPRPQNPNGLTPPFCFAKFKGFTGDQQYSPPRYGQKPLSMRFTPMASRGRPVESATESSFAQRGGAAQSGTTPHNSEMQSLIFSGSPYSNSFHSGPKARKAGHQNRGMGARRECTGPGEHPRKKGSRDRRHESAEKFPTGEIFRAFLGRRPRRRFGYFAAAGKVTRPAGRNIPIPVPPAGEIFHSLPLWDGGPKGPPRLNAE